MSEGEEGRHTGGGKDVSKDEKKRAAAEAAERRMREAGTNEMGSSTEEPQQVVLVETKAVQKLNSSLRMVNMGSGGDGSPVHATEGTEEEGKEEEQDQPITTLRVKMDAGGGEKGQRERSEGIGKGYDPIHDGQF